MYGKEEQLAEKFTSCFPNLSSDQERIAFFLTQDATGRELIGYEGTLKLYGKEEQLAEKFTSCFPNLSSDQERIAFFLTQDATGIRKNYIKNFSSPETRRKKGRI